jgi:hypothetical protein
MRDVIEMAREAGGREVDKDDPQCCIGSMAFDEHELKAFADLVRADEREACAKVCDELSPPCGYNLTEISFWDVTSLECAAAIRNRGQASRAAPKTKPQLNKYEI